MQQADQKQLLQIQDDYGFRVVKDIKHKNIYKIVDSRGQKLVPMSYVTRHKAECDLVSHVVELESNKKKK